MSFMRIFTTILALICFTATAQANDRVTLAMTRSGPIMVASEVLKEAYSRIGVEMALVTLPAERALQDAESGVVDGDVGRMVNLEKEHPTLVPVKVPLNAIDAVVYTCSPTVRIDSKKDLAKYTVGVRRGIKFAESLTQETPHVMRNSWDALFDLLFIGRIDAIIASTRLMHAQKNRANADCLRIYGRPLVHHSIFHYLHERKKDLVPKLEHVLRKMEASGESEAIRKRAMLQLKQ